MAKPMPPKPISIIAQLGNLRRQRGT
jgi:hypothetical protein